MLIVDIQPGPQVTRVLLAGELDMATERDVHEAFAQVANAPRVEVDLSKLEYCDSSGVNVFVKAYLEAQATGRSFHVTNAHGLVARVLEICGVLPSLDGAAGDAMSQASDSATAG